MQKIEIYTTKYCPYCVRAKMLLQQKNATFTEYAIDKTPNLRKEMMARSRARTVPQIFIGKQHIGGCDELHALERKGQLDKLLK
jgi:glutaredoxin 3